MLLKILSPLCFLILIHGLLLSAVTFAEDKGFRYKDGSCVNPQGAEGLNPSFVGECGDLRNASLVDQDLSGKSFRGANLENADLRLSNLSQTV